MRVLEQGVYEIGFKPEEIPTWFQDLLDELFDGKGVPKEYMAYVRVRNLENVSRRVTLRFLFSEKGSSYLYPPWFLRREDGGWEWISPEDTDFKAHEYLNASVDLQPGESVRIASAPYEEPNVVCEKARRLAQRYDLWTYRKIGTSAQGRPIPVLETEPREFKLLVDATMQS